MKKELLKSGILNLITAFFSKGSAIIISIIFARVLSVELFGMFSIIQTTTATLLIFISAGAGVVITKHVAIYLDNGNEESAIIFTLIHLLFSILLSLCIFFISLLFSKEISLFLFNDEKRWELVNFFSFIPVLTCVQIILNAYINGRRDFSFNKNVSIVTGLISIPISVYLVINMGLMGGVLSIILNQLIVACAYLYYFKCQFKNRCMNFILNMRKNKLEYKNIILKDSIPALLVGLTVTPTLLVIYQIANKYNTTGLEVIGKFGAITQWRNLLIFIPSVLGVVFLSYFSKYKNNDKYRLYNILTPYFCVYIIVVSLLLVPDILPLMYGVDFVDRDFMKAFYIVIICCLLISVKSSIGREIVFKENYWISAVSNLIWSLSFIFIYLYYGVDYDSVGIAISFLASHVISLLYFFSRVDYSRELLGSFLSEKSVIISLIILMALSVRFFL